MKFSVPYNNDFSLLEELARIKEINGNRIEEIYFSGPQDHCGSGRVMDKTTPKDIAKVTEFCHKEGIKANMLLNSTCEGLNGYSESNVSKVLKLVETLYREHGLERVTIANPLWIQKISSEFPKIKISASVLSQIDSIQRAVLFKRFGASTITPDRDINRNLRLLEDIRHSTGCELKLMVNEGCLYKCPYRIFHFNLVSHCSVEGIDPKEAFFFNCHKLSANEPSLILMSPWINPENLKTYGKITNYFKITGRSHSKEWIINTTKAYLSENFEGNLLDIMDSNLDCFNKKFGRSINNKSLEKLGFFNRIIECDKDLCRGKYCIEALEDCSKISKSFK
ncbi:MAG: U32 family peptidase [Candidatus Aenigmarchaeota archaeon]|nr:U32 family peptidase [Candidatus Aenigmarchaeota archaeon]